MFGILLLTIPISSFKDNSTVSKYVESIPHSTMGKCEWRLQGDSISSQEKMDFIKKTRDSKCWWKGTLRHCWKSVWRFLTRLQLKLAYNPAVTVRYTADHPCNTSDERAEVWNLLDEHQYVMGKENGVCTHRGALFSKKRDEIMTFVGKWVELKRIMLTEIS